MSFGQFATYQVVWTVLGAVVTLAFVGGVLCWDVIKEKIDDWERKHWGPKP